LATEAKYIFVRCGTPGFVAPEIINIKDMSTKSEPISDVFSAGIIYHHLLFGESIFPGTKYNDVVSQNRACNFNFSHEKYRTIGG
jgi:serine/threonine protein kinase